MAPALVFCEPNERNLFFNIKYLLFQKNECPISKLSGDLHFRL